MYKSLEKQIKVLGLLRQGKKSSEIRKHMKMDIPDSTISYIRQNTPDHLTQLIKLLEIAVENHAIDEQQNQKMKIILASLISS